MSDGTTWIESVTISWLPADANVHPWRIRSVPGKNWSLDDTLAIMARNRSQVSHWGPYEIDASRYEKARQQAEYLESDGVRYRAIDSFNQNLRIINCVHGLAHADPVVERYIQPVLRVGEPGTSRLAARYVRGGAFQDYPMTHDWVLSVIGADQYPIIPRQPGERIPREIR
jgi:hypothetical protein